MYKRSAENLLAEALNISPAVLLSGTRQVGKSTLSQQLHREYRVFDNLMDREAALHDPIGFIHHLPKPVTLDEIQKAPEVLEGIKLAIDQQRVNGHFLLTGSANVLDMKKAKDTLAGRLIEIPMWPLSQKEIRHQPDDNLVDHWFKQGVAGLGSTDIAHRDLMQAMVLGGYPEVLNIASERGRGLWFNAYISTYVERDIRDVGKLRDLSAFIRFFNTIAPKSCGLVNKSDLAKDADLSEATVNNYLSMLRMIYQIVLLPPYSANISKRFIKSPKLYMTDSGIFCHLLGITNGEALQTSRHRGDVVETFVLSELLKHISYSMTQPQLYHYRTSDKKEIDFILEKPDLLIAIEVKAAQSIKRDAFKHIIELQQKSSRRVLGLVLYAGERVLSFGEGEHERYAVPLGVFL